MFPDEPERAMVYGISFPQREVRQNLSPLFREARLSDGLNIGLLHANVGGNPTTTPTRRAPLTTWQSPTSTIGHWAMSTLGKC